MSLRFYFVFFLVFVKPEEIRTILVTILIVGGVGGGGGDHTIKWLNPQTCPTEPLFSCSEDKIIGLHANTVLQSIKGFLLININLSLHDVFENSS